MVEGHDKTGQLLPTDAASAAVQQHLATGKARIGPCPKWPQKHGPVVSRNRIGLYMSNEKNLGWLGYIGDYVTTQLCRDYNKPL